MCIKQFFFDGAVFALLDYAVRNSDSYLFMLVYTIACYFKKCLYL